MSLLMHVGGLGVAFKNKHSNKEIADVLKMVGLDKGAMKPSDLVKKIVFAYSNEAELVPVVSTTYNNALSGYTRYCTVNNQMVACYSVHYGRATSDFNGTFDSLLESTDG